MSKIVIVTPGQLGSNPRVVKEANALQAAGHVVHVIATKVVDFVEPRDQAVLATAAWSAERVSFEDKTAWRRTRLMQEAAKRLRRILPSAKLDALSHSAMTLSLTRAALAHPADLYIAHYPAALPAAVAAAKRYNASYAFDAEDFHPGDLPDLPEHHGATETIKGIEGRYLPQAAYVSAASPGISAAYAATYDIPAPTVILNVFEAARAPAPTSRGTALGPSLYWFSQVIGPDRGLECAVRAIARAETRPHLYLRGTARTDFITGLRALAADLGCADRLHFLEPDAPHRMEELAAQYDLGLVGETGGTHNRRIALTNKQFTYLLAGVPSVLSDIPAHRDFAALAEGAAFLYGVEDPQSMARVLDELLQDPERLAAARFRAHELGQTRFNWEVEAPVLLNCVRRAELSPEPRIS